MLTHGSEHGDRDYTRSQARMTFTLGACCTLCHMLTNVSQGMCTVRADTLILPMLLVSD